MIFFPILVRLVSIHLKSQTHADSIICYQDGKPELVQAASVSIHDSHGQFVENVHLQQYKSEDSFWDQLYERRYRRILTKAEDFLDDTGGPGDDVLFFIRFVLCCI